MTRYRKQGASIFVVVFCDENPAVDPPGLVKEECLEAMGRLQVDCSILNWPMRRLGECRQKILQVMYDTREEFNPDLVFIPSPNDFHDDHYTIARNGMRAFKGITTLGYELPWNTISFQTQGFIRLEPNHVYTKQYALEAYRSQKDKAYMDRNFVYALAKTRGVQAGCELAEAFEVIRWLD